MAKKIVLAIAFLVIVLFIAYWLQPLKKGTGYSTTIKYECVETWPDLPDNFNIGNPTGIGIDSNQNIIVFCRRKKHWPLFSSMDRTAIKTNTVLIISSDNGKLISSWGNNFFIMPHGLTVDKQNNIWVTDVGLHQVFKFTHDGKLLMSLGVAGISGNDNNHFNNPTDVAVANDGSFYISDGYRNSRILKYSSQGKFLFQWGKKGTGPGEFNIPHGISLDKNGNVYVADRENSRIQIFDANGKFIKQVNNKSFGAICSVLTDIKNNRSLAVDDLTFLKLKHRGSDIFLIDSSLNVESRFGRSDLYDEPTTWFHDIAIDKNENIYVCDILNNKVIKFRSAVVE